MRLTKAKVRICRKEAGRSKRRKETGVEDVDGSESALRHGQQQRELAFVPINQQWDIYFVSGTLTAPSPTCRACLFQLAGNLCKSVQQDD